MALITWKDMGESCHAKTDLYPFVAFIPKQSMAGNSPVKPSFGIGMLTIDLYAVLLEDYILLSVSYQKKAWLGWCHRRLIKGQRH